MEVESVYLNRWPPGKSRDRYPEQLQHITVLDPRCIRAPRGDAAARGDDEKILHLTSGHLSDDSRPDQDTGDRYHCDDEDEGEGSATKKFCDGPSSMTDSSRQHVSSSPVGVQALPR